MLGITFGKKQKIDLKALVTDTGLALSQWADNSTADSLLADLGLTRMELLKITSLDDEFESCREDIRAAMLAKNWRIWGEDVHEDTINRLYKNLRGQMATLADVAINARLGGYAVAEYVYRRDTDGLWLIDRVANKSGELDNYEPKADGSLLYKGAGADEAVNRDVKFLLLTSRADSKNIKGDPLAIRAYPAVQLRKKGLPYALQFIRRYAQPYVVGKQSGFGEAVEDFANKIFSFLSGGGIVIGQDDEIALHKLDSDGQAFARIERLANSRIQKLLLGRVKTSELDSGSRSAQETDDKARKDRITGYLDLLQEAGQHAINALLMVNRSFGVAIPAPQGLWFEFEKETEISLERAERDAKYLATGQVRLTEAYYTDVLGFEKDHIQLVEPAPASDAPALSLRLSQSAPGANKGDLAHDRKILAPKIDAIIAALADAKDYRDFEAALSTLQLPDGGMTADLEAKLKAAFAAGRAGADTWPE